MFWYVGYAMGKLTVRDDDKIYVPDKFSGYFSATLRFFVVVLNPQTVRLVLDPPILSTRQP